MQQGSLILRKLIAGEERDMVICYIDNSVQQQIRIVLIAFANDKASTKRQTGANAHTHASPYVSQ